MVLMSVDRLVWTEKTSVELWAVSKGGWMAALKALHWVCMMVDQMVAQMVAQMAWKMVALQAGWTVALMVLMMVAGKVAQMAVEKVWKMVVMLAASTDVLLAELKALTKALLLVATRAGERVATKGIRWVH